MSKLYLYAVFHANLNFSYIPPDLYPQILRRCYWPLLRIVEEKGIPLGLEFPAQTLETVNKLDRSFVPHLREMWDQGLCEVVGSGYVQAIMPLIPYKVNQQNLRLGNLAYEQLLGRRPTVAYVNEQVYSAGLPRLYHDAGYEAVIANWDSALPLHADADLLHRPCAVSTGDGDRISVIWHCLKAYRDFQQYIEREISLDDFLERLQANIPLTGDRAFPLYGSDWEVFDFKPWRVYPEGFQYPDLGEMERISGLLGLLNERQDLEFITPGGLLSRFPEHPLVRLESSAYPLPYKKQDQHSVARWAVGGRDNVRLNTQCHQLYQGLLQADWHLGQDGAQPDLRRESQDLWQELCFLWSSDFRTFTTEEKYLEFRNRMGGALERAGRLKEAARPSVDTPGDLRLANCSTVPATSEPVAFTFMANGHGDHRTYGMEFDGRMVPCQVTQRLPLSDETSRLTLEVLAGMAVGQSGTGTLRHEEPLPEATNAPTFHVDADKHIVETPTVRLRLNPNRGGTIESLEFHGTAPEPVIYCPERESQGPVSPLPGDLILEGRDGSAITDHLATEIQYPESLTSHEIFLPLRCVVQTEVGTVWKTYRVYLHQPRVDLTIRFQWRDVVPKSFRLGRMALNPNAFDRSTLYYATTNGGAEVERHQLHGRSIPPQGPAQGGYACLGATEGWVVLGDATKGVGLVTRPADLYSIPVITYHEDEGKPGGFQLNLAHSLGEPDETSHTLWRGHSTWSLSILGGRDDIIAQTRASALLANGGLIAWTAPQ